MSNSIYDKIGQKAKDEANEILETASNDAKVAYDSIINQAALKVNKQLEQVNSKIEADKKSYITSLSQTQKQKSLIIKKSLIHKAFLEACDELKKMNDNDLTNYVMNQLESSNVKGSYEVRVSSNDFDRYVKLFASKKVNDNVELDVLNKKFKDLHLVLSNKDAKINGGLILIGDSFDVDLSYEESLRVIELSLEKKISDLMFGEN